jgi:hypothetical protein
MNSVVSFLCTVFLLIPGTLAAQQDYRESMEHQEPELLQSPFQLTFLVPPLSTNGIRNSRTENKVSLNLFIGNSGAVNGLELGGFLNTINHNATGLQIAGFGNVVGKTSNGAQLSGFLNINGRNAEKFQGAGFMNVAGGNLTGVQASGFLNTVRGTVKGAQLAGFANVSGKAAGGFQGSGFINVSGGEFEGGQVAGFMNVARTISHGAQLSGFANIAGKGTVQTQVSGMFNIASHVRGVQVAGFLNICDSIEGIPVAFISVVKKNGYQRFEFSMNEVTYAKLSYKMGVRHLYTIYSFGKPDGPGHRWMYGAGFGAEFDLNEKTVINPEIEVSQEIWFADPLMERFISNDRLNLHNQARINFGWEFQEHLTLFVGPTLNVAVSTTLPQEGYRSWYPIAPVWTLYNHTSYNYTRTNVSIWFGINGGLRF